MKILAFVDIHGNLKALDEIEKKAANADILVDAGDISRFEMDLNILLAKLDSFGKPVLMTHGNHEDPGMLAEACKKTKNILFLHKKVEIVDNIAFIGYGGGGFSKNDPNMEDFFEKALKKPLKAKIIVFITHAPPYNTDLDQIDSSHHGNNTLRNLIIKYRPDLAILGHFHDNWGKVSWLGDSKIVNPGPSGTILDI